MLASTALTQLDAYQARILDLIETSLQLIGQTLASAQPGLAQTRWHLLRVLREYQLFKHNEIFDPLIASQRPELAAMARRMKIACISASEEYRLHTVRWAEQGSTNDWIAYEQAVRQIAAGLKSHLAAERVESAMLLSHTNRTRKP